MKNFPFTGKILFILKRDSTSLNLSLKEVVLFVIVYLVFFEVKLILDRLHTPTRFVTLPEKNLEAGQ